MGSTLNDWELKYECAMEVIRDLNQELEELQVDLRFLRQGLEVLAEPSSFPLTNETISLKRQIDDLLEGKYP